MITQDAIPVWPRGSEHDTGLAPTLRDIGVGLGRMPRFAGQLPKFYPVLCHVFTVADIVPDGCRAYALLHDAAEAIVGDVPTTWKTDAAREHEEDLLERITLDAGLPWPWPADVTGLVKAADTICLEAEAHALGHREAERWWPRAGWGESTRRAFDLTVARAEDAELWLQAGLAGSEFEYQVELARCVAVRR